MKRILGQALSVVATALIVTTLTPACAENDQSIFVRTVASPPQTRTGGVCLYTPDPSQAGLFDGTLDGAITDSYSGVLLVGSQLSSRADPNAVRAESNRAHLNGAIVRVTDPNGGPIGEFTSLGTGFVDTALNGTPSFGLLSVTLIDAPTRARIMEGVTPAQSRLVVANIKVFGKTVGGVDLETGEFQFTIRVCKGCLVSFETGDDPATAGVDCNLPLSGAGGTATVLPCIRGQDERTPCQTCLDVEGCRTGAFL